VGLKDETKLKLVWYLLFSVIGVFHAEVLSWSAPDVLYNPITFAFVTPVYAVHYILFGDIILRSGRRDLPTLYVFGALTGMYETFITKVYWSPPWNPEGAGALGIAWGELLWIGFTWHAFMTFLIPFRLMDGLFSPRGDRRLTTREGKAILLVAPSVAALFGHAFGRSMEEILISLTLSLAVILLLSLVFSRMSPRLRFTEIEQLVLGKRGRRIAIGSFVAVYGVYGTILRPEAMPNGMPIVVVLLIYAGLILMAHALLRRPSPAVTIRAEAAPTVQNPWRFLTVYAGAFLLAAVAAAWFMSVSPDVFAAVAMGVIVGGVGLPAILIPYVLLRILRARRMKAPATLGS
jgi:hypothetical protein